MSPGAEGAAVHRDRVCTFCGCTCDDIALRVREGRIVEAARACPEGREWFDSRNAEPPVAARVEGRPAETEEALEVAARLLAGSRSPLVYGLDEASVEAQEQAVAIADALGATLDVAGSSARRAWTLAAQRRGSISATLSELRNRADLFVFWGADPERSHPRFLERFVEPEGLHAAGTRRVIRIETGSGPSEPGDAGTSEPGDAGTSQPPGSGPSRTLRIPPESAVEALWVLWSLVRDPAARPPESRLPPGLSEELEELARTLRSCRYGAWIYDPATASDPGDPGIPEATLALVEALNGHVPFAALGLAARGNAGGAESVLTAHAGYPFAVGFAGGHPRFGPEEFRADAFLRRGEADAALLVGCDPARHLAEATLAALYELPLVVVDFRDSEPASRARAAVFTAAYGVAAPATVHRMDGVALRARPALPSSLPSDAEVLARLAARLGDGAALPGDAARRAGVRDGRADR